MRAGIRLGGEGGSAALAVPVAAALVLVVVLGLGDLGALLAARARAATAADAAALAAAVEIARGSPEQPRLQAASLARANGGRLVACDCPACRGAGAIPATVVVEVDVPFRARLLPGSSRATARARADVRPRTPVWLRGFQGG